MTTTAIKERPILFSAPMVRAIRDGSKTQTRRVVKPQPIDDPSSVRPWVDDGPSPSGAGRFGHTLRLDECPYGVPGDRLWVKERWYRPTQFYTPRGNWKRGTARAFVTYPDDPEPRGVEITREQYDKVMAMKPGLKSPRFMPRWASRITLEVISVRVERLQEITESGAYEEGCTGKGFKLTADSFAIARREFEQLWDSINAKRGYAWVANPWVWVVEFGVIEQSHRVGSDAGRSEQ